MARKGLAAAQAAHSPRLQWKFRLLEADILIASGRPGEALDLTGAVPPREGPDLSAAWNFERGYASLQRSNYRDAERFLAAARSLAGPPGASALADRAAFQQAILYAATGRTSLAESGLRSVVEHTRDSRLAARAIGNLGYFATIAFRYEDAVYWLERAKVAYSHLGDERNIAKTIGNLGWAYKGLGDYDVALESFGQAVEQSRALRDTDDELMALTGECEIYLALLNPSQAHSRCGETLKIALAAGDLAAQSDALADLALASTIDANWDAAQAFNDRSRTLRRKLRQTRSLVYNVQIEARIAAGRRQFALAEKLYRAVIASGDNDNPALILDGRDGLAGLYAAEGKVAQAEREFHATLAFAEAERLRLRSDLGRLAYHSSLITVYQDYVAMLVSCGRTERALELADSSRARLLSEKWIADPEPGNANRFMGLARESGSVLLSYWLGPDRSLLWVATPRQIVTLPLPPEAEIRKLVLGYRTFLENQGDPLATDYPAGPKLWDALVAPALAYLPAGSHVTIVPDGILHSLNFETLPVRGGPPRYWIEDVTVTVAPSLGLLLANVAPRPTSVPSLLLIGAPQSPAEEFPALTHAAEEIAKVRSHFPPANRTVYQGRAALTSAYRAASPERFSIIHFATHASANQASPLDSALILSPGPDGFELHARDIAAVPIHARLVTISACRGAGAKTFSGEGLVGLAWAFLQAGARNVIAGLWDVDDASTPALMDHLYEGLGQGIPPAEALRHAKLAMIHSDGVRHKPYYWGPFQLYRGVGVASDGIVRPSNLAPVRPLRPKAPAPNARSECAACSGSGNESPAPKYPPVPPAFPPPPPSPAG